MAKKPSSALPVVENFPLLLIFNSERLFVVHMKRIRVTVSRTLPTICITSLTDRRDMKIKSIPDVVYLTEINRIRAIR